MGGGKGLVIMELRVLAKKGSTALAETAQGKELQLFRVLFVF